MVRPGDTSFLPLRNVIGARLEWKHTSLAPHVLYSRGSWQPQIVLKINVKDTFCTKSMRINLKRAWCVTEYQKKEKLSKECGRMEHQSRGRTGVVVFNTWKPTVRLLVLFMFLEEHDKKRKMDLPSVNSKFSNLLEIYSELWNPIRKFRLIFHRFKSKYCTGNKRKQGATYST